MVTKLAVRKTTAKKTTEGQDDVTKTCFTKTQLLASKKYRGRKDVVNALLEDNRTYTMDEADAVINKFMKGRVK